MNERLEMGVFFKRDSAEVSSRLSPSQRQNSPGSRLLAFVLALAFFALYSVYSFFQYRHFVTPSWDLGIFTQLAQNYARAQAPIVPIKGHGFNLWGDHFHPILVLLTPFYYFFPSPQTLLYVQNGLIAVAVFLLCRFAQQGCGKLSAFLLTIAFGLSFGVQQAVSVQFHEVAFALPFFVLSLGNLVLAAREPERAPRIRRALLWALPLVFVKEDMGITVAMIGIVALLRTGWLRVGWNILFPHAAARSDDAQPVEPFSRRFQKVASSAITSPAVLESFLTVVWGISWSAAAVALILPFFNTAGQFDYADKVDFAAALGDPLQAFATLFYPWTKTFSLLLLFAVGVLLWVLSPLAIIALPTLCWRLLSPNEGYWESTWHYSLVLMPIVTMALVDVLATPPAFLSRMGRGVSLPIFRRTVAAAACGVALVLLPFQPLKELANPRFATTELSAVDQTKQQAVNAVPQGVTVASDLSILTYLVPDRTVYWIGHEGKPAPDYVVIDSMGTAWGNNSPQNPAGYASERFNATYFTVRTFGTISVMKRTDL